MINDVTGKMTKYIHSQLEKNDPFDARELCAKFTTDVVSNCIFAVDAESFTRENSEIRANGRRLTVPSLKIILSFILLSFFPFLKKIVNFPVVPKDLEQFFVNLMDQALKYREESKTDRDDYLGYLISLKKKKQIESIDMAAHAGLFERFYPYHFIKILIFSFLFRGRI